MLGGDPVRVNFRSFGFRVDRKCVYLMNGNLVTCVCGNLVT